MALIFYSSAGVFVQAEHPKPGTDDAELECSEESTAGKDNGQIANEVALQETEKRIEERPHLPEPMERGDAVDDNDPHYDDGLSSDSDLEIRLSELYHVSARHITCLCSFFSECHTTQERRVESAGKTPGSLKRAVERIGKEINKYWK